MNKAQEQSLILSEAIEHIESARKSLVNAMLLSGLFERSRQSGFPISDALAVASSHLNEAISHSAKEPEKFPPIYGGAKSAKVAEAKIGPGQSRRAHGTKHAKHGRYAMATTRAAVLDIMLRENRPMNAKDVASIAARNGIRFSYGAANQQMASLRKKGLAKAAITNSKGFITHYILEPSGKSQASEVAVALDKNGEGGQ